MNFTPVKLDLNKYDLHCINAKVIEDATSDIGLKHETKEMKITYWVMLPLILFVAFILLLVKSPFIVFGEIKNVSRDMIEGIKKGGIKK